MAINFPNNPSNGDTHTGFIYNSTKGVWESSATEVITTVYSTINDLPLSGASTGTQAYVTGNNTLYFWNGSGWYKIALINTSPSISGVSSSYPLAKDGTATTVTIIATDPEGLPITYSIASDTSGNIATVAQGTGSNTNVFTVTPSTNSANAGTFSLTFRASDGVNIATAVSEFTLRFIIQNSNYTTALITTAGSAGTNSAFTDSSSNSHTITAGGNAAQTTFSPYRHGGYSVGFDGSNDYLTITDSSLELSGEFTVSFWLYLNSLKDHNNVFHWSDFSGNGSGYDNDIYIRSSGQIESRLRATTAQGSSNTISAGQWYYLTVTRNSSNVIKVWVDENEEISYTGSGTLDNYIAIGYNPYLGGRDYVDGYIRDFKITDASVSSPTIPSGPVASDSNTKLLTCHLPYFADGSTNDLTVTSNGNVSTIPFAPYDYEEEYTVGTHGGSVYLDGTGDYLDVTTSAANLGTGDFTVECWAYWSADPRSIIYDTRQSDGNSGHAIFMTSTTHNVVFYNNNATVLTSVRHGKQGRWNHIAVVRNSGTINIFINGKKDTAQVTGNSTNFNAHAFRIGQKTYGGIPNVTGNITDFRISSTARYSTDFTPATAPLSSDAYTSLLLNMQGAKILDKSQSTESLTLVGNTTASTAQYKYLPTSMYFDGTGDYVTATSPNLSESYTIEFWFYMTSWSDAAGFFGWELDGKFGVGGYGSTLKYWNRSSLVNTTYDILSQTEIEALEGSWNHFALVANADSTNTKIFINGTLKTDISLFDSHTSSENIQIGAFDFDSSRADSPKYFHGYLSDFRITKGFARYTTSFTPRSAALQG